MVVMAVAVVAIMGGMEEMVGWIDRIECDAFVVFVFLFTNEEHYFFHTWHTVYQILFIVGKR